MVSAESAMLLPLLAIGRSTSYSIRRSTSRQVALRTVEESQNFVLETPMILLEHQSVPSMGQEDVLLVPRLQLRKERQEIFLFRRVVVLTKDQHRWNRDLLRI